MCTIDPIIDEAAAVFGGKQGLADALGITLQAVRKWKRIPPGRVIEIERITGIPREQLRADLFGAPRPRPPHHNVSVAA